MKQAIRIIVVNADEEAAPELRSFLLSIENVKIVAEIDEPAMIESVLRQFTAEVLLLHLDPNPEAMMVLAAPLIESHKGKIAAIAMSEVRDADLVMRAMRAGVREFLWKPFNPDQLIETIRRVGAEVAERRSEATDSVGRLITVVGTVGGAGATTLCTNVGVELANLSQGSTSDDGAAAPSVAIVDLDFRFGQIATLLDAHPAYTIAELCETSEQIDAQMLDRAMLKHDTGVHILARPADLSEAEQITAAHCAGVLARLQEAYDFVIVDGPSRSESGAQIVYEQADLSLLVLQLLVPSVRNADRMISVFRSAGYSTDRLRLVCNRSGNDSGYLEAGDVEGILNRKIDWHLPDDWRTASSAVNMGAPLLVHAPKSKLRLGYQKIAMAIFAGAGDGASADVAADAGKKGLFSFFGRRAETVEAG